MKGYKAFNKGMICRDKQYAENTIFEEENAEIYYSGMHFCKYPLDSLWCGEIIDKNGDFAEFAEVEALGDIKTNNSEIFCTNKLKIGKKINWKDFIKNSIEITKNKIANKNYSVLEEDNIKNKIGVVYPKHIVKKDSAIISSDRSSIISGDNSTIISGDYSNIVGNVGCTVISGCDSSIATEPNSIIMSKPRSSIATGDHSIIISGKRSRLTGGCGTTLIGDNSSIIAGGDYSKLAGDDWSKLVAGRESMIIGGGKSILVGDVDSKIKGKKGSLIVLIDRDRYGNVIDFKAEIIDGIKIKEDTFYRLVEGELEEV